MKNEFVIKHNEDLRILIEKIHDSKIDIETFIYDKETKELKLDVFEEDL